MRATQILLYLVPPRRPYRPPPADMSREAVKRLHIDGTASWGRWHHQTRWRPGREEPNSPGKDDTTSTARSLPLLIMGRTSSLMPHSLPPSPVRNFSPPFSRPTSSP